MRKLIAVVLLLCAAGAYGEDGCVLRPKYKQGEQYFVRQSLDLYVRGEGSILKAHAQVSSLDTVLKAAQYVPHQERRLYTCYTVRLHLGPPGKQVFRTLHEQFVGVPLLLERKEGRVVLEGTPPEEKTLQTMTWLGTGFDGVLPNGAVKRGDTWTPRKDPLGAMPAEAGKRGPVTCIFEGRTRWKGKPAAKIAIKFRSNGRGQITGFWAWKGACYVDPDSGKPIWLEFRARYHPDHPADSAGELVYQASVVEVHLSDPGKDSLRNLLQEKSSVEQLEATRSPQPAAGSARRKLEAMEHRIDKIDGKVDDLLAGD